MPTATINSLLCVQQATGVDSGVNTALAGLPEKLLGRDLGGISFVDAINAIPAVLAAMDNARSDPDQIYITTTTNSGRANAIWPAPEETIEMQAMQSNALNISMSFDHSQNISLWDQDKGGLFGSDDDLLGSVTLFATEQGEGEIAKKAYSGVENSCYYVIYRVD